MFATDDTIVAIATPPGRGAIGLVRLSGARAAVVAQKMLRRDQPLEARRATLTHVVEGQGRETRHALVDQVVATYFPAPASYTGEDVVEIGGHGSPIVLTAILRTAIRAGARLARPGEFTLRAFLNGRIDLVQAEAIADLIDSVTPRQAQLAMDQLQGTLTAAIAEIESGLFDLVAQLEASVDFPDEGYHFVDAAGAGAQIDRLLTEIAQLRAGASEGRLLREGATVAIGGRTNTGKSSIFNKLSRSQRAIVTPHAGTTRDLVTESIDLGGLAVTLVDTAGLRPTDDPVELEGVTRANQAVGSADVVVVVLDRSRTLEGQDHALIHETAKKARVIVANKVDLPHAWSTGSLPAPVVETSMVTGRGIETLRTTLAEVLGSCETERDCPLVANVRHIELLQRSATCLERASSAAHSGLPEEVVLTDLHEATRLLGEIAGHRAPEDVLQRIFERFCVGK